ncbi:hypothetical protein [Chitinophaga sp. GbtcB8]|uniref:hypothetical protein n=1 Tax=Chitinophaga sp. GbtcB8 TaxID=2824753 RepID=UPI001C305011|nr:hypothetical protein [Chitinophaga sp. GbtcB8]
MLKRERSWLTIALINLSVVALLGLLLRSKILFPIPAINFGYLLHAHSHFAFTGWITLCLLTLMTYRILPEKYNSQPRYKWLLAGILLSAVGMLLSFPFQGYAFFSILFSTLSILVSYVFSWFFIKDLLKTRPRKPVIILAVSSLVAMVLSSVGPFTLAYMMASHSVNALLYRDAIYTYLHLQYNGFFTLGIFTLFVHHLGHSSAKVPERSLNHFATFLSVSVLPTLALSYLWHFPNAVIRTIAVAGCGCLVVTLVSFIVMMRSAKEALKTVGPFTKKIGVLSMIAFAVKTAVQIFIVFPAIGEMVFSNRPVIIGYLHLVMLGFVTLYLFAYLLHIGYFETGRGLSAPGIIIFTGAAIANEIILAMQGFPAIFMLNSTLYLWLLWAAAIGLFTGALVIAAAAVKRLRTRSDILLLKYPGSYYQRNNRPA